MATSRQSGKQIIMLWQQIFKCTLCFVGALLSTREEPISSCTAGNQGHRREDPGAMGVDATFCSGGSAARSMSSRLRPEDSGMSKVNTIATR